MRLLLWFVPFLLAAQSESPIRAKAAGIPGPVWIGWAAPSLPMDQQSCEKLRGPVRLEGSREMAIFVRFEGGTPGKIRTVARECEIDSGGVRLEWLDGITPAQSIAFLMSLPKPAVYAVAMHAAPEADAVLERAASSGSRDAVFWLGTARGQRGYEVVSRIAREHTDAKLREHAVFALSQSKVPEAVSAMVHVAQNDSSPQVRGQALFWLAHKNTAAPILEAIDKDPDTSVKKKAVFALSQLPSGESVPKLIQVARSTANPAVRQQAIFWLGQSRDSRASEFLEQLLTK